MAAQKLIVCKKCQGKFFFLMLMTGKMRVVCASAACGEVPLDLVESGDVFRRLPTIDIEMKRRDGLELPTS